jgi:hypothetical protein
MLIQWRLLIFCRRAQLCEKSSEYGDAVAAAAAAAVDDDADAIRDRGKKKKSKHTHTHTHTSETTTLKRTFAAPVAYACGSAQ